MKHLYARLIFSLLFFAIIPQSLTPQTFPAGFSQVAVGNVYYPTSMAVAPDGRIFVTEKAGKVKVVKNGAVLPTPFLQVSVEQTNERGLSSVCIDPDFNTNHYVYIYYTTLSSPVHNRLSRFTANGDVAVAGSEVVLIDFEPLVNSIHNGGGMFFGPDGKLYISIGDDRVSSNAQDLNSHKGKLLRINRDGSAAAGNPFSGSVAASRVWALGFRNPFTNALQPGTGRIFVNDVGEATWEEINNATTAGKNFGWPACEGNCSNPAYTNPVYTYMHGASSDGGCAVSGGTFFNPNSTNYPSNYIGKYFFLDYCGQWIKYIDPAGGSATIFGSGLPSALVSMAVGHDGNLYYFSISQNTLYKIVYAGSTAPPAITQQPSNVTVSQGQQAIFSVNASGATPLSYQWKKNGVNISGATSKNYTIASAQPSDQGQYMATVNNAYGTANSNSASLTVTAYNAPPAGSITSPANNSLYKAGDTIHVAGTGSDPEDGTLPASAFSWIIKFHHDTHFHPGPSIPPGTKTGTFVIPTTGEPSSNVWFEIILVVKDSKNMTDTTAINIYPKKAVVQLTGSPSGVQLTLDGQPVTTPYTFTGVVGAQRSIGAISPQTLGSTSYTYNHWSNNAAQTQTYTVPSTNTVLTAYYQAAAQASCSATGSILREFWANASASGTSLQTFPFNTLAPTSQGPLSIFEGPLNAADNYASRIRGYICPPATGNYTFWIASDNSSELWISPDDNPANKVKRAYVTGYTASRDWAKYSTQQSAPIYLQAGVKYYIEAIHMEGTQGDNLAVGWQLPNGTQERPIPGIRLAPFSSASSPTVSITSPLNNSNYDEPAYIVINANAVAHSGASITKVEFFQNGIKLGEDLTAPYSYTWANVAAGHYTLTAKASDSQNLSNYSPGIKVFVGASSSCNVTQTLLREYWANYTGTTLAGAPFNSAAPTSTSQIGTFEAPQNVGDYYASRIRGYVCAPATGNYTLWIASDNTSELWMSPDDNPANKVKRAYVSDWTMPREWTKYPSQQAVVYLEEGRKYYIEAIHREGTQGDHLAVGWALPNGTLERPIPGSRISIFTGGSTTGNTPPSVAITSPYSYQRFSTPVNITIMANASDPDGSVTKVEFYNSSAKLGEITTPPYNYGWNNVTTGTYTLTAKAYDNSGAVSTSAPVNIEVTTCTTPMITAQGPTTFCSGGNVTLTATSGYEQYQWKVNGNYISTATSPNFVATASGDYQVKTVKGTCVAWSAPVRVTVNNCKASGTPTVAAKTSGADTSLAGKPAIKDAEPISMKVYPNPNNGMFTIELSMMEVQEEKVEVSVVNSIGQVVLNNQYTVSGGYFAQQVELDKNLPTGVYILKVGIGKTVETTRLILTK